MSIQHPIALRKAIERERLRKEAVSAIHRLEAKDCVSWSVAADALNNAGSVNERGRKWSWSTLKLFVQVQRAVHGITFDDTLPIEGRTYRACPRRNFARSGRAEEVAKAVAVGKDLKHAAALLNERGVVTGTGKRWTAERVSMFMRNHRSDAVSLLEALQPDPFMTWDGAAARLNKLGCRTEKGLKWTGNNLRFFVGKENRTRSEPLLAWMAGREGIGSRFKKRRDDLAEKVKEATRGKWDFKSAAKALNDAGIKTLQGREWTADRLMNFDKGYRRAGNKGLLKV